MSIDDAGESLEFWYNEAIRLRTVLATAVEAMQESFDLHAPGKRKGGGVEAVEDYAALSTEEIDRMWDFYERHASHKLAKAIMAARAVAAR